MPQSTFKKRQDAKKKQILSLLKKNSSWQKEKIPQNAFKKYKGEHIAIINNKVIVHGKDFKVVAETAYNIGLRKNKMPVFAQIPKGEINVFIAL